MSHIMQYLLYRLILAIISTFVLPGFVAGPVHGASRAEARQGLTYANQSLVEDTSTGKVFLSWAGVLHWIANPATLDALGYGGAPFTRARHAQLATIPEGSSLYARLVSGLVYPLAPITSTQVGLSLSQPSVVPGQSFTLDGSGFRAGEAVTVTAPNAVLIATADANGDFLLPVTVPTSVSNGLHHVFVHGSISGYFGMEVIHVIPAAGVQLSASPATVQAGEPFYVSGSGFLPGERVEVFPNPISSSETIANAVGAFGPLRFSASSVRANTIYAVLAYGVTTARSASTQITVTAVAPAPLPTPVPTPPATLTVMPSTVNAGSQTVLSGTGFQPSEQILIHVNGTLQGSVMASGTGTFAGYLLAVPMGTAAGNFPIQVSGVTSGRSASATLTVAISQAVTASIAVSPVSASAGSLITVSGTGFSPGEAVVISFNNQIVRNVTADAVGSFANGSFVVAPGTAPGQYGVAATGTSSTRTANSVLTVSPAPPSGSHINLARTMVHRGDTVTIAGRGFFAKEIVLIFFNNKLAQTVMTENNGMFSDATFTVPVHNKYGTFTVKATGSRSRRSATTKLTVVAKLSVGLTISPTNARRGHVLTVTGHGYSAGETVLLYVRGRLAAAQTADKEGNFSARFTIAGSTSPGVAVVVAMGARSHRHAQQVIAIL
jgi:large repetitive protein